MTRKMMPSKKIKAEVISFRASSKIKYGLELMSRKQRRNASQVLEWAIAKLMDDKIEGLIEVNKAGEEINVLDAVWHSDEITRFVKLADKFPHLLSEEEEIIWHEIDKRIDEFSTIDPNWDPHTGGEPVYNLDINSIRARWDELMQIASEK